jgi:hypothetical protein
MWIFSLWRACNLTAFIHSSTGPVVHPFASCHEGPGFKPQGGTYLEPGFSCLRCLATLGTLTWSIIVASSEAGFVPNCHYAVIQCDNNTWSCTALLSRFHARCRSSFWLHNDIVGCWGGALWRACNLTAFIPSSTGPVVHPFASRHEGPGFNHQGGYLCGTRVPLLVLSGYKLVISSESLTPHLWMRQKTFAFGEGQSPNA